MDIPFQLERIKRHALAGQLAPELMAAGQSDSSVDGFLEHALDRVRATSQANFAALTRSRQGRWETLASSGSAQSLERATLAEALDREEAVSNGQWAAAPLDRRAADGELLVLCCPLGKTGDLETLADALAGLLAVSLQAARDGQQTVRRLEQLETILEIAATWNQTLQLKRCWSKWPRPRRGC